MNVLNIAYFNKERLEEAIEAVYESVKEGGMWIVGRTEENGNHVTIFRRMDRRWEVIERLGNGSEIETLVVHQEFSRKRL